jgi:hypothetical protein
MSLHALHPRLYRIWSDMRRRCNNYKRPDFKWYGALGVKVCAEWGRASSFIEWAMASGYRDDLTLDRIDVRGDYGPDNCRWADIKTQERNRRNNRRITFNGETMCMSEWAERAGVSPQAFRARIERGWTMERATRC